MQYRGTKQCVQQTRRWCMRVMQTLCCSRRQALSNGAKVAQPEYLYRLQESNLFLGCPVIGVERKPLLGLASVRGRCTREA